MTKHIRKTACAVFRLLRPNILPPLMLAVDFVAVVTVSVLVLWLIVVMPVRALAQEPQQPATARSISYSTASPEAAKARLADWQKNSPPQDVCKMTRSATAPHINITAARSPRT